MLRAAWRFAAGEIDYGGAYYHHAVGDQRCGGVTHIPRHISFLAVQDHFPASAKLCTGFAVGGVYGPQLAIVSTQIQTVPAGPP